MIVIQANNELDFLHQAAVACQDKKIGRDSTWQIAPVMASIPYSAEGVNQLHAFQRAVQRTLPLLAEHGRKRAKRAYGSMADTLTKPSYIRRIHGTSDGITTPQSEILESLFVKEPLSGGLVFSIFLPQDLQDRKRPGYVPCLVAGSLLLHRGRLQLNAFFRSQSLVEFGLHDLLFLRELQYDFLRAFDSYPPRFLPKRSRPSEIGLGSLNLHFARVVVPSRLARNRRGHLKRSNIFEIWLDELADLLDTLS